jgi:hypothetical protein
VDNVLRNPTTPARHFLACRVESWRGELVTNVYVHFAVQGHTLYLEMSSWALPPCDERFRIVDKIDGTGPAAYLRAIRRGLVDTPRTVGRAPLELFRTLADTIAGNVRSSSTGQLRPGYDYGAETSVRQLAMNAYLRNSLVRHDFSKYSQIIERRVIAAVHDFLESKGVDVTEFGQRAVNILNNGVMHTGKGDIDNSGAVGPNAKTVNAAGPTPTPSS